MKGNVSREWWYLNKNSLKNDQSFQNKNFTAESQRTQRDYFLSVGETADRQKQSDLSALCASSESLSFEGERAVQCRLFRALGNNTPKGYLVHRFINTLTYSPQSRRGRKGLEFSFIRPFEDPGDLDPGERRSDKRQPFCLRQKLA